MLARVSKPSSTMHSFRAVGLSLEEYLLASRGSRGLLYHVTRRVSSDRPSYISDHHLPTEGEDQSYT
jgi:hypothetical protein